MCICYFHGDILSFKELADIFHIYLFNMPCRGITISPFRTAPVFDCSVYHCIGLLNGYRSVCVFTVNYYLQLLMEYCSGSSMSVNIRRKRPIHIANLKYYTEEILNALAYLHNKDVVHKSLRVGIYKFS
jgi:serine/threonine protein kinase